jgi:predicted ATPase
MSWRWPRRSIGRPPSSNHLDRRQEAKSLGLRAAVSLSRLRQRQGKRDEACELLAPIYGWFTEGVDTAHLPEAKALLETLVTKHLPHEGSCVANRLTGD